MDLIEILNPIPSILAAGSIVILLASLCGKLYANIALQNVKTKLFGVEFNDWYIISAEAVVLTLAVVVQFPFRNLILGIYFGALLFVAIKLRGTRCNCFGISNNQIDRVHLALLSLLAAGNLSVSGLSHASQTTASLVGGIIIGGAMLTIWKHKGSMERKPVYPALSISEQNINNESVGQVMIITQQGCNSCRVLSSLLEGKHFEIPVKFIDEKNSELVRQYKIASFPTALLVQRETHAANEVQQLNGITAIVSFLAKGQYQ